MYDCPPKRDCFAVSAKTHQKRKSMNNLSEGKILESPSCNIYFP